MAVLFKSDPSIGDLLVNTLLFRLGTALPSIKCPKTGCANCLMRVCAFSLFAIAAGLRKLLAFKGVVSDVMFLAILFRLFCLSYVYFMKIL